jgi:type I restriction enzyme S subunit
MIRSLRVPLFEPPTQKRIGEALGSWDNAIGLFARLIVAKQAYSAGIIQKLMFTSDSAKGHRCRLGEVASESTLTNDDGRRADVMGVSKFDGITPMRERSIGATVRRYKLLSRGEFAYNPMRINIGSIARWAGERTVLVSPDYVVFKCRRLLDPRYLDFYRRSRQWQQFMDRAGSGGVRVRIHFDDLAAMSIWLPSLEYQQRTADALETLDHEIALLLRYRALLSRQKDAVANAVLG